MPPVWSPEAIYDLAALRAYIEQDNPAAAQRVVLRVIENVETLLPNNPETGRPRRVPGTRELVIPGTPFNVPYRVVGNTLQILRVFRTLAERSMTKPTRERLAGTTRSGVYATNKNRS
jgi:toxin ParE1/3/4